MFKFQIAAILGIALIAGGLAAADRTSADAYLVSAPTLVKDGNYKTLEDMCKRALQADDTCPDAHFHLGLCLEKDGKLREAFKEFQNAATVATKEKDAVMAGKANTAAKRVGVGFIELDAMDTKLAEKLQKLADEALEAGQLETAKQAYASLLVLLPDNAKVKESYDKTMTAITERGDPVKSKVAAAMLAEVWYKLGIGKRDEATVTAKALSARFNDTESGSEAAALLERDFAAPKKDEVAKLSLKLKEQNAKILASAKPATPSPSTTDTRPSTASARKGVDVEAVEKSADEDTKKMAKDALVAAFKDAHQKGKSFYSKATPGSDGNQENVAHALEQFIKAESIYQRIETENLSTGELADISKESSMLRYGCMKMTILGH